MVKKFEVEVEKVGGAGKSLSRQPAERREAVKSEPVVETKAAVAPAPVEAAPSSNYYWWNYNNKSNAWNNFRC